MHEIDIGILPIFASIKKQKKQMSAVITLMHQCESVASGKGVCLFSGAVMVLNDVIIYETSAKIMENDDPTAHAAIIAIRKTRLLRHVFLLKEYELYLSEKPCPMCLTAIAQAEIKKIYYKENQEIKKLELPQEYVKKAYTLWEF